MHLMTPDTQTAEATHQSLVLINHLARVARRRSEVALEPTGLRPRHVVALTILRESGPMTQGALGEALRLDPTNLVGLLNELEEAALLERRRDPLDRRRHIVELSARRRRRAGADLRPARHTSKDELFKSLTGPTSAPPCTACSPAPSGH